MSTTPTSPGAANPTELEQLRAEVATVRAELAELKRFLHVSQPDPEEGETGGPSLMISCAGIMLQHPESPAKSQALFMASADGPCLSLWGADEKARVTLEVTKDGGTCALFGKDLKLAVQLMAEDQQGRGQVTVFEADKPRALLKAMDNGGGTVSAVHDDGTTRACMTSTAHEGGGFLAVTPDFKVGVKITSATPDGGAIIVNRLNGKPAVIVGTSPLGGVVIINDPKGQVMASLPPILPAEPDED